MPLVKGSSQRAMGHNYDVERKAGKSKKQSMAIMLSVARKAKEGRGESIKSLLPKHDPRLRSKLAKQAESAAGKRGDKKLHRMAEAKKRIKGLRK